MNNSSKSTNISISISHQSVLVILTVFVNSPAARITVEKIWLRYITIAITTPLPHITHITNCQSPSPLPSVIYYNMWTAPNGQVVLSSTP